MTSTRLPNRLANLGAIGLLVLAPLLLLGPCLFGDEVFLPFDPARFPPAKISMSAAELEGIEARPSNLDVTELPLLVVPEIQLAGDEIEAGRFPSWNPYARFGGPLFANALAGLVYPPNWTLLKGSDPARGLALGALLSYGIAGVLMFAFLRACQLGVIAALFGALAFAFGGTLTVHAHFYMRMNALIWLPGMLLAALRLERTAGHDRIPAALGLAVCIAMTWLAGFPPYAISATAFAGLYAVWLIVRTGRRDGLVGSRDLTLWIGGAFAVGLLASAVQLWPMLAYYPESSRDLSPPPNAIAQSGFDVMGFLGYLMPTAFGHPDPGIGAEYARSPLALLLNTRTYWADADPARTAGRLMYPSNYNFTEYTIFFGAIPLLLAIVGIFGPRSRPRTAFVSITALFVLIGTAPSWLQSLYGLPGFATPMRFIGPLAVACAAFAGLGFDACMQGNGRRLAYALSGVSGALALVFVWLATAAPDWNLIGTIAEQYAHLLPQQNAVAIATGDVGQHNLDAGRELMVTSFWEAAVRFGGAGLWLALWMWLQPRSPFFANKLAVLGVLLAAAELITFARETNTSRPIPVSTDTDVQSFLRDQRVARRGEGGVTVARAAKLPKVALDLPSGLLFPERIRDLNAYAFSDPWSHKLFVALYGPGQMVRDVWPNAFPDDERLERPLFDLLGTRYLLSTEKLEHAGTRVGPELRSDAGEFFVYERANPLPRAFVVHDLRVMKDEAATIATMIAPDLDPRAAVLVTSDVAATLPPPAAPAVPAPRATKFRRDDPGDVLIEVAPGDAGYLVLCDAALSGWEATVNGAPVDIARGNLFMSVVPIGSRGCEVRLRYTAPGLTAGLTATTIALLIMASAVLSYLGSRRRMLRVENSD